MLGNIAVSKQFHYEYKHYSCQNNVVTKPHKRISTLQLDNFYMHYALGNHLLLVEETDF